MNISCERFGVAQITYPAVFLRFSLWIQEAELRCKNQEVEDMKGKVEASEERTAHAEAAVLAMIPLNLKVSELRRRLAEKEAALSKLQVRLASCLSNYVHFSFANRVAAQVRSLFFTLPLSTCISDTEICIQEEYRVASDTLAASRTDLAALRKRFLQLEVEHTALQESLDMHAKMEGLAEKRVGMAEAQKVEVTVEVEHLKAEQERLQDLYTRAIDRNTSLGIHQQVSSWLRFLGHGHEVVVNAEVEHLKAE
jgi:hypothetical protein